MTFDELCKDFNARKPQGKAVAYTPFFNAKIKNGNDSTNDILRRFLRENDFEYINDFSGVVWFLYYGVWECCTSEIKDGLVHFYMCKFTDNLEQKKEIKEMCYKCACFKVDCSGMGEPYTGCVHFRNAPKAN